MREELYFNAQDLAKSYTQTPSSHLSVPRMIKGQPAFCHQGLEDQKKPKKIVMTHPLNEANDLDKLIFTLQLMTLHQEGFEVFLQSGNTLTPFNRINVKSISEISGEKKKVSDYASQLNCSGDEIYLLDDSKIAPMIKHGAEQWEHYRLNKGSLSLHTSPLKFEGFNQLIQRHQAEIKSLSLGYCPYLIKQAQDQNIGCDSLPALEELDIDLTATAQSNMLNIALIGDVIQKSPNLKTFKLKLPKHVSGVDRVLFEKMVAEVLEKESIESFQIYNPSGILLTIPNPKNSLRQIKIFNLYGRFDLDPDLFSKICSTGNLISFAGDVDIPDDISTFQLQKIEELNLNDSANDS